MKRCTSTDVNALGAKPTRRGSRMNGSSHLQQNEVEVEFLGSLQRTMAKGRVTLPLERETVLSELLRTLEETYQIKPLRTPAAGSGRPGGLSCLVLVNGREVSALRGAQTPIKPGDKLVFIPIFHGG
ncbi:MAG: MoaD/ThiS family protein [Candidatus Bathyarchaeia archaeon]